jgi:hypothetical protein
LAGQARNFYSIGKYYPLGFPSKRCGGRGVTIDFFLIGVLYRIMQTIT